MKHLIMRLESPLMAFGGETIDNYGVIRAFPAASMLTGLLANALGWRRIERERHQGLQDRLVFAARIDREPHGGGQRLTDFQTARLGANDRGWTTRGAPEGRAGGANTYDAPHLRYRDYYPDTLVTVALRLAPDQGAPNLESLATALDEPARPLFIGRKPCLPSAPLFAGWEEGDTALAALLAHPLSESQGDARGPQTVRAMWPQAEDPGDSTQGVRANRRYMITDQRNWISGLHGGGRGLCEGTVDRGAFKTAAAKASTQGGSGR